MSNHKFSLGAHLKDRISGMDGIATARIEFINGCMQYLLRPSKIGKDGLPSEGIYLDQQQLELVAVVHKNAKAIVAQPTGGPSHVPGRSLDAPPRRR